MSENIKEAIAYGVELASREEKSSQLMTNTTMMTQKLILLSLNRNFIQMYLNYARLIV